MLPIHNGKAGAGVREKRASSGLRRALAAVGEFLRSADLLLLGLVLLASFIGVVLIRSATASYGTNSYIIIQLVAIGLGVLLFILFSIVDIDIITQKWWLLLGLSVLLIAGLYLFGEEGNTGNKSWIRFGRVGIQPSEFIKVLFTLLLAKQMSVLREKDRGISSPLSMVQIAAHLLVTFGLIVVISRDLGSALVFVAIFAVMCFAGSVKLIWFVIGIAGIAAFAPYAWEHLLSKYQKDRIMAPYFPEVVDPDGLGITWHANQSKIALASGGLTGQGYMQGAQSQSDMLPFKHTDFIFAVAGEEFGMVGCILLVLLLTAIILRCVYVGVRSHNYMNMLICCGFSAMLAFQTFENVGMCLGLTPVVGLTLPFISYGGSSVIIGYAAMGIVSGIRLRPNPNRSKY